MGRKDKRNIKALACALALALTMLTGCGAKGKGEITSLDQLGEPGTKIGMANDTNDDKLVAERLPQAELEYYQDAMAGYLSVSQGKLDAFVYGKLAMDTAIRNGLQGVRLLDETLGESYTMAVAIAPNTKIPNLEKQINAFLDEVKKDGTLDDMVDRWLVRKDETMPEIPIPENSDLHLVVGTSGVYEPFTYYVGTELRGYDIELAYRFVAWLGASVEFKVYDYNGIIAAAQGGDVDCLFAAIFITPERQEALRFSQPTYVEEIAVMVRSPGAAPESSNKTVSWQDYNGKRIGVLVGPLMEDAAAEFFPDSEYLYFDSYPDCATALLTGKIDGFLGDEPGMISMHSEQPEIDYIHESLTENNYAFAFRKDDPASAALCQELDAFLTRAWADGTMDEIAEIWLGVDEARKVVDMSDLTGENGTIRVVTTSTDMPWSYIKDGKNVGYDIDLVVRFCRDRGYALALGDVDFAGRIPAVQSGKYDFTTDMNVTLEREEQVLFSSPTAHGGIVLAVRASDLGTEDLGRDIRHAVIAVYTGSNFPDILQEYLPDADIRYFNTTADELNALKSGKIDAIALDEPVARYIQAIDREVTLYPEVYGSFDFAYVITKDDHGAALCEELSEYIRSLKADGTLDTLQEKWFDNGDSAGSEMTDYRELPAVNGTIYLAAEQIQPFVMAVDGLYSGYEIEILAMFCRDRGFALKITDVSTDAILPSVQTGKSDIGCGCISVTEERKENLYFSEPDYTGGMVLLVMKDVAADSGGGSFLSSVADSFQKTFIRENRWKLFVGGIGTTMLITVLSILFGTGLGFGVFMLCRRGNPVANLITRFCLWLVQGMPMVVLLMILYYIIFGSVSISGIAVAVIGFTLTFGAAVFGLLKMGVGAIDKGQYEAAYALGYSNYRTFFKIILPQALPHVMSAYKGEIVGLIKATAIVGYIAVQDLTKMGDIVRSRTYEAFFPLIAITVIYFVLEGLIGFFVSRISINMNSKRRKPSDILKGVKTDD